MPSGASGKIPASRRFTTGEESTSSQIRQNSKYSFHPRYKKQGELIFSFYPDLLEAFHNKLAPINHYQQRFSFSLKTLLNIRLPRVDLLIERLQSAVKRTYKSTAFHIGHLAKESGRVSSTVDSMLSFATDVFETKYKSRNAFYVRRAPSIWSALWYKFAKHYHIVADLRRAFYRQIFITWKTGNNFDTTVGELWQYKCISEGIYIILCRVQN